MQTIVSFSEKLDNMTAEEAVEVLRKLQIAVVDVNSEISEETGDLLLDIDEDTSVLDKRLVQIEKLKAKELQKQKEQEAKAAAKAAAKAKAASKAKEAAKAKAASKTKAKPKAKPKAAAKTKATAKKKTAQAEAKEEPQEEAREEAIIEAAVELLPQEPVTVEAPPEVAPEAVPVEALPVEVVEEKVPEPVTEKPQEKIHKPLAEIVTVTEEELLAERERKERKPQEEEEGNAATGVLAKAELRHEAEERRRHEREQRQRESATSQGARLSDVKADPEIVAAVIRRDRERKQKQEEERERRIAKRGKAKDDGPLTVPLAIKEPGAEATQKFKAKPEPVEGKQAKKRVKRAERTRIREDNIRREAAAAVKEFQAGTAFGGSRKRRRKKREDANIETTEHAVGGTIEVDEMVTVEGLAALMEVPISELILALMDNNVMATKNQQLDMDTVRSLAEKFNYEVKVVIPEEEELFAEEPDAPENLAPRPPVVTVMGHVDHGKTSLLDAIRRTKVAEGEAGGITQHIAAYDFDVGNGRVTFLDTPGHQAFTQMRARGANVTDIVVLVVAANDGVKPQTIEAIDHARAAEVPIVVAINKCDLANAQPDRVRQELTQYNLIDEAWGGKTIIKNISAKMNEGVDELMELLVLQAEMLDLKANPVKRARGTIIEAELTTGLGPVAWVLVQNGTLRVGDAFLAGQAYGRVRSLTDCRGKSLQEAGPAMPVIVTGFNMPPDAGDVFVVASEERVARNIAEKRESRARIKRGPVVRHITLEDFHARFAGEEKKVLHIIIKADVQGSVDVLQSSFAKLGNEEVSINVVHAGAGGINESDVLLAEASDAVIIGFQVTANAKVKKMAETANVEIRTYRIIYEALDEVRSALEGMLTPETREVVVGHAEVREVFRSSALGTIAGCYQTDGETERGARARLVRDGVIIHEGNIQSLRRHKDDARSVAAGFECGIKLERFEDVRTGDVIECYKHESIAKTLEQENA